jgi:hypothetical protein
VQSIEDHGDEELTWSERSAVAEKTAVKEMVVIILRFNPAPTPHSPISDDPEESPMLPTNFEREAASHQRVHPLGLHRPTPSASIEMPPL